MLALDAVHDHESFFAGAATGAVSDGAVIGTGLPESGDGFFEENAVPFVCFWGIKFKGNHRLAGGALGGINVTYKLHAAIRCVSLDKNPSS